MSEIELGILGLSWQEKTLSQVKAWLKGTNEGKQLNETVLNNVHRSYLSYLARGYKPINFSIMRPDILLSQMDKESINLVREIARDSKTNFILTDRILRAVYFLAGKGKIPYQKYDPKGYETQLKLSKRFDTEKGFLEKYLPSKKGLIIAIVGVGAVGSFMFYQYGKGKVKRVFS